VSYVIYTTLVSVFVLVCVGIGLRDGAQGRRTPVAIALAAAMVAAQFALISR
jgi:hypothetical protein